MGAAELSLQQGRSGGCKGSWSWLCVPGRREQRCRAGRGSQRLQGELVILRYRGDEIPALEFG